MLSRFGGQLPHFSNSDFAILENRIDKFGSDSGDDGSLVITLLLKEPIIAYDAHLLTSPYSALEAAPLRRIKFHTRLNMKMVLKCLGDQKSEKETEGRNEFFETIPFYNLHDHNHPSELEERIPGLEAIFAILCAASERHKRSTCSDQVLEIKFIISSYYGDEPFNLITPPREERDFSFVFQEVAEILESAEKLEATAGRKRHSIGGANKAGTHCQAGPVPFTQRGISQLFLAPREGVR